METIGPDHSSGSDSNGEPDPDRTPAPASAPAPTPDSAASDLQAATDAARAVRDRPWPTWLYPVNTVLLGAMALAPLLPDPAMIPLWLVVLFSVIAANSWAGYRMGTPMALPTSRGFLFAVALASLFLVTAVLVGLSGGPAWIAVVCAAGTSASYGIGSYVHYRDTRR